MTFDEFNNTQPSEYQLPDAERDTYNAIYDQIDAKNKGGNGWLLLAVLVGAASFVSTKLAQMVMARHAPQPKAAAKPVEIITYSLRDAKAQQAKSEQPVVDPAQVGKIMQIIMPVILIIFALNQSAAFAIYMIGSSLIATGLTIAFSLLIEFIFKKFPPRTQKNQEFDARVINPHAKYFKGGKK